MVSNRHRRATKAILGRFLAGLLEFSFVMAHIIGHFLSSGNKLFCLRRLDAGGEQLDEFGAVVAKGGEGLV